VGELSSETPFFQIYAPAIYANGYTPIPIRPGTKVTRIAKWQLLCSSILAPSDLQDFIDKYPFDSVALVCGATLAIDIDSLDETRAAFLQRTAVEMLGPTPLVRVGRYPKRMLLYRSSDPPPRTQRLGDIEILGSKAYVLAFGIHPQTARPYEWTRGASPADLRFDQVPAVGREQIQALVEQLRPDLTRAACGIGETLTTPVPEQKIMPAAARILDLAPVARGPGPDRLLPPKSGSP
jgi:hypothetical protein